MKTIKVLNLYACLGGNRKLWDDVSSEFGYKIEVVAIELDPELCVLYQELYPDDIVICTDAKQFLLDHYNEFDFIWFSSPCPTHSRARFWSSKGNPEKVNPVYPDMSLYEIIIFLQNYYDGVWTGENVIPYYKPLIPGVEIGRHLFWGSFKIQKFESIDANIHSGKITEMEKLHGVDLSNYKGHQRKDKLLRNMVHFETGEKLFRQAMKLIIDNSQEQFKLEL